jgi:hypothetical protein
MNASKTRGGRKLRNGAWAEIFGTLNIVHILGNLSETLHMLTLIGAEHCPDLVKIGSTLCYCLVCGPFAVRHINPGHKGSPLYIQDIPRKFGNPSFR